METQAALTTVQAPAVQPPESGLPKTHHDAYRMKLAGRAIQDIADTYKVDRTTVWRWCKAVEQETMSQLADEPVFNLIVREVSRLTDNEEQARDGAEQTTSDRAKAMFLAEARRAAVSRQNLLITTGIFPKAPEQIYRVTATMKPKTENDESTELLSRAESINALIEQGRRMKLL